MISRSPHASSTPASPPSNKVWSSARSTLMGRLVPPFPSCIPSLLLRPGAPDLSPAGPGFDEAPPQRVRRTLPLLTTPSIINSGRCLHNEGLPLFTELPRRIVFSETCIHTPAHLYGTGGMRAELRLFSELPISVLL